MTIDLTKLNKFVGMLGSEHAGEQSNAARFIQKMALERKMSMVEFLTAAYGGGADRIVYKTETVYRDAPTASKPRQDKARGADFGDAYRNANRSYTEDARTSSEEIRAAEELRKARERAEDSRNSTRNPRPNPRAYGTENLIKSKIKQVLGFYSSVLTPKEIEFLEGLSQKIDNGYEMTPKQRAWYADIMKKVGY